MTNEIYFQLEGEFLGVCALDGYKLKYLRLRTVDAPQQQRDVVIKVPKELRAGLVYQLAVGDRICCTGIQKDWKFKASAIEKVLRVASVLTRFHGRETRPERLAPAESQFNGTDRRSIRENTPTIEHSADRSPVKILICQKSHCFNNGGKEVYSALTAQLNSHNLDDLVTVKLTGCLKCCKQSPNLVVLPDRSSYHNVRTSQIPAIISKVRSSLTSE
ncbi:(2Fe-2S) ferredoxin domain-containing protein [Chamaesiphon sp.]|uniref:(2Fe-2S) ferredoxin domain-containing protein n=1 Tax=Chamaesiphon sp. TaxID=2814140 RepID=UPI003594413F